MITFSCSEEENPSTVENYLSPPEWLLGSWEYNSENITRMEIEVSSRNVKLLFHTGTVYDIANQAESIDSAPNGKSK